MVSTVPKLPGVRN